MSTENTLDLPFIATLERGNYYDLGGYSRLVFERGDAHPVSQATRDHLEEHAVERRLVPGFNPEWDDPENAIETVCAFTFKPNDGSANNVDGPRTLRVEDQPRPGTRSYAQSLQAARLRGEVSE